METHLQTLARAQAELGVEVRVVCVNHEKASGTVEEWDGPVRVTRVARRMSLSGLDVCPGLMSVLWGLAREAPDLLHLHTPNPTMLLPLVLWARKIPLVVTHHSDIVRQRLLRRLHDPFERLVYGRAAAVLATSPTYIEGSTVLQRYAAKVHTLPHGLDLQPFLEPTTAAQRAAVELRAKHGGPLWLCVGRLIYYKGLDTALKALASAPGKLLVIGEGPLEKSLREQAQRIGVTDRVVWYGRAGADELVGAYHAATALWFPSDARSESFGLVQVEAMACGCPVINTAIPASGVAWVSRHEETGLTVPVGDAPALAAAARRLVEEPGLRDRLGMEARERAQVEFAHKTMAERSLDLYCRALATVA